MKRNRDCDDLVYGYALIDATIDRVGAFTIVTHQVVFVGKFDETYEIDASVINTLAGCKISSSQKVVCNGILPPNAHCVAHVFMVLLEPPDRELFSDLALCFLKYCHTIDDVVRMSADGKSMDPVICNEQIVWETILHHYRSLLNFLLMKTHMTTNDPKCIRIVRHGLAKYAWDLIDASKPLLFPRKVFPDVSTFAICLKDRLWPLDELARFHFVDQTLHVVRDHRLLGCHQ